jgi:hypothetical protein
MENPFELILERLEQIEIAIQNSMLHYRMMMKPYYQD